MKNRSETFEWFMLVLIVSFTAWATLSILNAAEANEVDYIKYCLPDNTCYQPMPKRAKQ